MLLIAKVRFMRASVLRALKGAQAALKTLTQVNKDHIRMVYIKNTLSLETIMVSEALLEQVRARDDMEIMEEPRELRFDESGALLDFA